MTIRPKIQECFSPEDIIAEAMGDYALEFLLAVEFDPFGRSSIPIETHLMSVMLIEGGSFVDDLDSVYDLRFGIRNQPIGNEVIVGEMDFSQDRVRRCIRPADRERVLELVCRATWILARHVRPAGVTMTTFDRHLPPKALTKYERIGKILEDLGYRRRQAYRDPDGRGRWHYHR